MNHIPPAFSKKRIILLVIGVGVIASASMAFVNNKQQQQDLSAKSGGKGANGKAIPVTVAKAGSQSVPIEIRSIGNVLSYSVVNIVPQVGGQLKKVFFTQGQFVKQGDLLFLIDPSPYQAALDQALGNVEKDKALIQQAQANMEKDRAQVGLAQANLAKDTATQRYAGLEQGRYSTLLSQGAVSKEQTDQMVTNLSTANAVLEADQKAIENAIAIVNSDRAAIATAKGTLAADQAAAETTKIQLGWTTIRSPIDGKTSSLNVYAGNVVTAASANMNATAMNPLVTIDQVKPIYVTFTVPEQYLDVVRKNLDRKTLRVEAEIEGKKSATVLGNVSFLENTVNTQTGTVVLRAEFANTDLRLFPGQFVNVVVTMPPDSNSITIPTVALQTSQKGNAVYKVTADQTVVFTPVEVQRSNGDVTALSSGLQPGDTVVTDGQLQLTPGSKVQVVKESTAINQ